MLREALVRHAARALACAACAFVALTVAGCGAPTSAAPSAGTPGGPAERPALLGFDVSPPGATVVIDGTRAVLLDGSARPTPVSAGRHRLIVSADGYLDVRLEVTVDPGEAVVVAATLWPELPAIDRRRR